MYTKRKLWVRALSVFLSALIVVQILPLTVWANELQDPIVSETVEESTVDYGELAISEEVIEKRDAYSKTYLLEDGTYCTISSSTAIHTEENGKWEEITPLAETPETANEASTLISAQAEESGEEESNPTEDTEVGNGLISQYSDDVIVYGASYLGDNGSGSEWEMTQGSGFINFSSFVLVKPNVLYGSLSQNKSEVTVDASIITTCNTQGQSSDYEAYIQLFTDGWEDTVPAVDELLAMDNNGEFINVDEQIYDYNSLTAGGQYVWNITSTYSKWENGTLPNNGLIIRTGESINTRITDAYLLRYYRVIDNNDSGFTYHSEDMGRAGILYINNFTNTPLLERSELSITGNKMPVSLSRFISYELGGESFGAGGRWNYSSDLAYSHDTFIWNTFDGSSKRFQRSSDDETDAEGREKWVEYLDNGGGCVLWTPKNIQSHFPLDFSNCYIVDEEDNVYKFNSSNKVTSITNGNATLNINYSGSNITSITDGAGRVYEFDNSGFTNDLNCVKSISLKDSSGYQITYNGTTPLDIEYTYVEKSNKLWLASATYADGKTVNYEYDNYGRLTIIKNIDNSKLEIEYYNENPLVNNNPTYASRIKSYTKSVYDTENEAYVDICTVEFDSDETYRRTITTTQGGKVFTEISQYGTNLDVLYATDSDGNEYYADYDGSHTLTSLVTGTPDSEEQLVKNGEMEEVRFGVLVGWSRSGILTSDYERFERYEDNYAVRIQNSIDQERSLYQDISIDGKTGDKYVISAWGKANATIPRDTRFWGIKIDALRSDGTTETIHQMQFDTSLWYIEQMRKTAFSLPFDTTKLTVRLLTSDQLNTVEFDSIELYKADDAYVASVDDPVEDGCICSNCTEPDCSCTCTDESTCNCIPCKRGITTAIDSNGNEVTTTTDGVYSMESTNSFSPSGNYLISSTDENGVTTFYSYDENNGTLTSMSDDESDDGISYTYNAVGLLKTVSQTVTNIMTGEDVNMVSSYTYDGDNLTQINHNGSVYSFEYDLYGNVSNVKIGDQSLATYSYTEPDRLGYLLYGNGDRINYTYNANGNIMSVSTQKDGEETDVLIEYTYTYDADGTLLSYTDNVNGTVTNYTDNGYSIVIPATDDSSEDTVIYSTAYNEDTSEDTVTLFGYTFNTKDIADTYDVQTGQTTATTKYTLPCDPYGVTMDGEALTVTDYFGKNISTTYSLGTDDTFENADVDISKYDHYVNNTYTYVTDESNKTSSLVSSVASTIKLVYNATQEEIDAALESGLKEDELTETLLEPISLSVTTSYEYDDAGRIQKIYRNGIPISVYKYDEAGQLTEEINYTGEDFSAIRYTYDAGGNISSKVYYDSVSYNETSNTFSYGTVTKTVNYTYGNSESYTYDNIDWDDRLTNYDGMDIEYDELGNPLNYKGVDYAGNTVNATLEWNGRLLTSFTFTKNGDNETPQRFEYYYNADGLRTKKVHKVWDDDIDGYQEYEYIEYVWEGNLLKGYRISFPTIVDDATGKISQGIVLPLYDANSEIIGVAYQRLPVTDDENNNNPTYHSVYFIKDAQGNVISAYDPATDIKVNYSYDAYGQTTYSLEGSSISELEDIINSGGNTGSGIFDVIQIIAASASLGFLKLLYKDICMFAYRGYMYDGESGLYYNQSRYYSPEWGRFLNADDPMLTDTGTGTTNANNMFAYCENDPINRIDPDGCINIKIPRKWVATFIDILISAIPGINGIHAPIKTLAKAYGKAALKSKVKTPLASFIRFVGKNASKAVNGIKKVVKKIPGFGNNIANKIPTKKIVSMIAGMTASSTVNKILNLLIKNIDLVLSIGGLCSGILDYIIDKKLDGYIRIKT